MKKLVSAQDCSSVSEVERFRDRRMSAAATVEFALHLVDCSTCSQRDEELASLQRRLRNSKSDAVDPFTLRRLRAEILGQATRAVPVRNVGWGSRFRWLALAGFALVTLLLAWHLRNAGGAAPSIQMSASRGAIWNRESEGDVDLVELSQGTLDFEVHGHPQGKHLVVLVPEGRIEDVGTRFSVTVDHGHTAAITVSEGEVVFHRPAQLDLRLLAGMTWHPPIVLSEEQVAPVAQPMTPPSSPGVPPERTVPPSSAPAASTGIAIRIAGTTPQASAPQAASGANGAWRATAAQQNDEDFTYMQTISLLRAGKTDAAKQLARQYLARFPDGLRKKEMAQIALPDAE